MCLTQGNRKQSGVTVRGHASFADLNNEGVLDFFYHNHFQMLPETDWDVGVSAVNDANEMTIRASVSSQSCRLEFLTQIGRSYRLILMGQLFWASTATACWTSTLLQEEVWDWRVVLQGMPSFIGGSHRQLPSTGSTKFSEAVARPPSCSTFTTPIRSIWCCRTIRVDDINAFGYALINTGTTQR